MKQSVGIFEVILIAGLCLGIYGCASTAATTVEKEGQTYRVEVNSLMLDNYIQVEERMVERVNDLLTVQIRGRNVSRKDVQFQYRFIWLDEKGFALDTIMSGWETISLHAKEVALMRGMAPTPAAVDFLMSVRFVQSSTRW